MSHGNKLNRRSLSDFFLEEDLSMTPQMLLLISVWHSLGATSQQIEQQIGLPRLATDAADRFQKFNTHASLIGIFTSIVVPLSAHWLSHYHTLRSHVYSQLQVLTVFHLDLPTMSTVPALSDDQRWYDANASRYENALFSHFHHIFNVSQETSRGSASSKRLSRHRRSDAFAVATRATQVNTTALEKQAILII